MSIRSFFSFCVAILAIGSLAGSAVAQSTSAVPRKPSAVQARIDQANQGTIGVISGGIGGTYIRIATDLASVLHEGNKLRVLAIAGRGSVQNINDILYLRGIDIGIVQSDVLAYFKRQPQYNNIESRIHYITKLYNEEFHLVASSDIKKVSDLAGRKVNFGVKGSGTFMTASTVFRLLRISPKPVHMDQALAIEKIKRGEIAATIYVSGKPSRVVADLKREDGLHIVPVDYVPALRSAYLPARFTNRDYPSLISQGETVNSIAVGAVMAVYNWNPKTKRYAKVVKFINAFFSNFDKFLKSPRHKKWHEVNLSAELPGWKRFGPAARWLAKNGSKSGKLKTAFNRFLSQTGGSTQTGGLDAKKTDELFRRFLKWQAQAKTQ